MFEHEGPVLHTDLRGDYLVSVGVDQLLKLFNVRKEKTLVREISFQHPIEACSLLNDEMQLLLSHGTALSLLKP